MTTVLFYFKESSLEGKLKCFAVNNNNSFLLFGCQLCIHMKELWLRLYLLIKVVQKEETLLCVCAVLIVPFSSSGIVRQVVLRCDDCYHLLVIQSLHHRSV